jgi:Nuclease-related domain
MLTKSLADADASSTVADEDLHLGIAGSSASRKADRLRQERERRKSERSPLGRAWAGAFPSVEDRKRRADERHWRTGAEGEQNLAALLAKRCLDVPMLHDRAVPRSRANIDHIAIAPTGVYVIDCKRYKGKIEVATPSSARQSSRSTGVTGQSSSMGSKSKSRSSRQRLPTSTTMCQSRAASVSSLPRASSPTLDSRSCAPSRSTATRCTTQGGWRGD